MPRPDYGFERVTRADYPLLRRWLAEPHVRAWWTAPVEEEMRLIDADVEGGRFAMWIASFEGRPFAYAQDADVGALDRAHLADLPEGARSIDLLIGEPDMTGRGHGRRLLHAHAMALCARGAPLCVVEPDAGHAAAIAAYRAAGFEDLGPRTTPEGEAVRVLTFRSPSS